MKTKFLTESILSLCFLSGLLIFSCKKDSIPDFEINGVEQEKEALPPIVVNRPPREVIDIEKVLSEYNPEQLDELICISDCLTDNILPIGAIVTVKEETELYKTQDNWFDKYERTLQPGEILYVTDIGLIDSGTRITSLNPGWDSMYIKVAASDGLEGWVFSWRLFLIQKTQVTPSFIKIFDLEMWFDHAEFSKDGTKLVAKEDGEWLGSVGFGNIYCYDVSTGKELFDYDENDSVSNEFFCISPDSTSIFYMKDYILQSYNIKTNTVTSYGEEPIFKYENGELVFSKKGDKLCVFFPDTGTSHWFRPPYAVVYTFRDGYNSAVSSYFTTKESFEKIKDEFFTEQEWSCRENPPKFEGMTCKNVFLIPEKDILLQCIERSDSKISGIYFYRLSTMELLKIENPLYDAWKKEYNEFRGAYHYDGLIVSPDRSKIGIFTQTDTNLANLPPIPDHYFYVYDADFSDVEEIKSKSVLASEEERAIKEFLCRGNFEGYNKKTLYSSLSFCDNGYFSECRYYEPESLNFSGTYYIEKTDENFILKAKLNIPSWAEELESDRIVHAYHTYVITPDFANIDYKGALFEPESDAIHWPKSERLLYMDADNESPGGEEYDFYGDTVIKYPLPEHVLDKSFDKERIFKNYSEVELKCAPHEDAKSIDVACFKLMGSQLDWIPPKHFYGYYDDEREPDDIRHTLGKYCRLYAIGQSKEKSTIDGVTAPWILCHGYMEYDSNDRYETEPFWFFAGDSRDITDK